MLVNDLPLIIMLFVYFVYYFIGLLILSIKNSNIYSIIVFSSYLIFFVFGYYAGKMIYVTNVKISIKRFKRYQLSNDFYIDSFSLSIVLYISIFIIRIWCSYHKFYNLAEFLKILLFIIIAENFYFYLIKRTSFARFLFFCIPFIMVQVYLGGRHVIMELISILIFLYSLYRPIKFSLLFNIIILGIAIMVLGGVFKLYHINGFLPQLSSINFWEFIFYKAIIDRTLMIGSETIYYIINNWQLHHNLFYGLTFVKRLCNLINIKQIPNLGYIIYSDVTNHYGAYDPISLIGDFYVNFGIYGIPLMMPVGIVFGFILNYLKQIIYSKYRISLFDKSLLVYSIFYSYLAFVFIRTFVYSLDGVIVSILEFIVAFTLLFFVNEVLSKIIIIKNEISS